MGWKSEFKKALKKAANIATLGGYHAVEKNWTDIRTPLAYAGAGALLASGIGAGLGAAGIAGMSAAGAAASGAVSGALAGGTAGMQARAAEKAADKAVEEQNRIAAQEAEQARRLQLLQAGSTPEGVSSMDIEARRRMQSQYRRNQVSRQTQNKKLGGSSSTLG